LATLFCLAAYDNANMALDNTILKLLDFDYDFVIKLYIICNC